MSKTKRPATFITSDGFSLLQVDTKSQLGLIWIDGDLVFHSDSSGHPVNCWEKRLDGNFSSKELNHAQRTCVNDFDIDHYVAYWKSEL